MWGPRRSSGNSRLKTMMEERRGAACSIDGKIVYIEREDKRPGMRVEEMLSC